MATDKDILDEARQAFDQAADAEQHNREEALADLKFARLGEQWPEAIRKQRELDQRPCLTINRLPSFVRQVVNDARQNKPAIKVLPADDTADPQTAEIINGLIRNIEYTSNADVAYDTALESAVTGGFGYFRISADYAHDDSFDLDLSIQRIVNPFTVYGDPHSTAADSSDWNTAFVTELMRRADFERRYKGAEPVDWDTGAYSELDQPWAEGKRVMVAEYWQRDAVRKAVVRLSDGSIMEAERYMAGKDMFDVLGVSVVGERDVKSWKVVQRLMTGAEVLETNEWAGRFIPIIPVYGDEINIEGKRYFRSLIRDAKDPQRMFNYWRTTSTELVALAPRVPYIGPRGAFTTDAHKWASANTKNWPYIEFDGPIPPQRQPLDSGGAIGAMQEAMAASDDMKSIMGLYDASLGAKSNETSGRAILARQREGDVSTFHFIDNLSRAIRHAGRVLIDLIPSFYTGERIVRVLGQDGAPQTVPLGQPVPLPDGTSRVFDLSAGKYDLTVTTGPSFTTKREEAAVQMTEFVRAYPQAAPLVGDLIAKNQDWPGAEEFAKRFQAMLPAAIRGEDPAMQQAQQQMQQLQGQLQQLQQQLAEANDDKAIEARKLDIDAFNAETNRLKAIGAGMAPEQVQALVVQTMQQLLASPDVLPGAPPMAQGPMPPQGMQIPNQPPPGGFFTPPFNDGGQITNP